MSDSQETSHRRRVLMTGALGRVGSRIAPALSRDHELILTDLEAGEIAGLPVHAADLTQHESIDRLMEGVDTVVHLAISLQQGYEVENDPAGADDIMQVNVAGTQHLFEAARRHGVGRLVYMSSVTVYMAAPVPERMGVALNTPLRPRGLYGCTKVFGECLACHYCSAYDMTAVCLRLGHPNPLVRHASSHWVKNPESRGILVAFEDIEQAIRCAIHYEGEPYLVADIVSESDTRCVDLTAAEPLGYRPRYRCTEAGFDKL